MGLPLWLSGKESAYQCSKCRFDPWVGKILGGGNGNPLQYSCLENLMDGGDWQAIVHGVAKESDTIEQLNNRLRMMSLKTFANFIGEKSLIAFI